MRHRIWLAALLAGTIITPVLAQDRDGRIERRERGDVARTTIEDRASMRGAQERVEPTPMPQIRQQMGERAAPQTRPDFSQRRGEMPVGVATPRGADMINRGWRGEQRRGGDVVTAPTSPPVAGQRLPDGNGNWRGNDGQWRGTGQRGFPVAGANDRRRGDRDGDGTPNWRDRDRDNDGVRNNRDWDRNNNGRVDGRWDRNGDGVADRRWDQNRDGVRDRWNNQNWNNNKQWNWEWRNDRRYDWQRYRTSNRYLFRQPRYASPFGYNGRYQRFGIGIYIESSLFGSRYRINDPWRYRLPDAQWPYEWTRYYDDVLLVDTRNGYIVDVIYDFFW